MNFFLNPPLTHVPHVLAGSTLTCLQTLLEAECLTAPLPAVNAEVCDDKLFNILNSYMLKKWDKLQYAMVECLEHNAFPEFCINWIAEQRFHSPRDKRPHINSKQFTVKALLMLWTDLKDVNFTHCSLSRCARVRSEIF